MKKKWPKAQIEDFIRWHESVIAQYPPELQKELRRARMKWLPAAAD